MTKERRLAIEMWEFIVEHFDEADVGTLKEVFADKHPEVEWRNICWFCEYCRRDFRPHHPGRQDISRRANNCHCCPLYKYEIKRGNYPTLADACGCATENWGFSPLFAKAQFEQCKRAAEMILRLLKNEVL